MKRHPPSLLHRCLPGLLCLLALSTQPACAAPSIKPFQKGFSSPQSAAQFHVLAGELAAKRQQPQVAAEQFLAALELNPDVELAQRATTYALVSGDDVLVLKTARRWLELEPTSLDAREVLARAALRQGALAEAQAQCEAIIRDHAGGEADGFRLIALLYSQEAAQAEPALKLMAKLQSQWPQLPGAHYALGLLALRFGKPDAAEASARTALKLDANYADAQLLLASTQIKQNRILEADQTIERLAASASNRTAVRLGYVRLLLESQQTEAASRQYRMVLRAEPDNVEARFGLGLLALDSQAFDEAAAFFKPLSSDSPRQNEAAYYLGRIAQVQRRDAEALGWYEQVGNGNLAIDATLRRADLLAHSARLDEALEVMQELRERYPAGAGRFAATEAQWLLDSGKAVEALAILDTALGETPDDIELLYARALVHERGKRLDAAEADLRRNLVLKPDDARALNALGYLLTTQSSRYTEARGLIEKALVLQPDDAAIQDSMGWVLFRQGQAADARPWLEKAYAQQKDAEIAAHLGEVLWTLGEKDNARKLWKAALGDNPDHAVLRETVQRLSP